MKYALLSDIHGNIHALEAVLETIRKESIDSLIFLGDYFGDFPFPNEVIDKIRSIPSKYAIAGNKEAYLKNVKDHLWKHPQFNALYWNFDNIQNDNLNYLDKLPVEIAFRCNNKKVLLIHDVTKFLPKTSLDILTTTHYDTLMSTEDMKHQDFLIYVNDLLNNDLRLTEQLNKIQADIILFGHTHIQWHATVQNKILINSGSAGLSLDHNNKASYTTIDINSETVRIEERRIDYDTQECMQDLKESGLFEAAPGWSEIIINEIIEGREYIAYFFKHAKEICIKNNYSSWPIPSELWETVLESWNEIKPELKESFTEFGVIKT